ncbi:hypothetical protein [Nonomuraea fuscirosea]|uniref:hypothetical protein n=1 Tax=Nonomuraea fuscirosea TaxID=1291556 RepID=UPI00342AAD86
MTRTLRPASVFAGRAGSTTGRSALEAVARAGFGGRVVRAGAGAGVTDARFGAGVTDARPGAGVADAA